MLYHTRKNVLLPPSRKEEERGKEWKEEGRRNEEKREEMRTKENEGEQKRTEEGKGQQRRTEEYSIKVTPNNHSVKLF